MQSPPIVVGDVVITPASISSLVVAKEQIPGWVRGHDARTGRLLWTFHTVPQPGEAGHDSWIGDSWRDAGKVTVWTAMSADAELGYVYLPTNTTAPDFYGGHRPGDNRHAESLLCLDAKTGRLVWSFQTVHHGLWDYDNPAAPNLLDVTVDGRRIKAVAQITKQGFVYTFNRVTGEPIWPIEERPVPRPTCPASVPRRRSPFPTKPPPFEYQGVSIDDLADFTPAIRAQAVEAIKGFRHGPLFTPPSLQGTINRPGSVGGANWGGAAVDPETGMLYVPSRNGFSVTTLAVARRHAEQQPAVHAGHRPESTHARRRCRSSSRRTRASPPSTCTAANTAGWCRRAPASASAPAGASQARPAAAGRRQHLQRPAADQDAAVLCADDRRQRRWPTAGRLRQGHGARAWFGRPARRRDRHAR